jgi:hypothetical protein
MTNAQALQSFEKHGTTPNTTKLLPNDEKQSKGGP